MNPYKVLKVEKKALLDEIKKAYRELAKQHHPDKGGDSEVFNLISRAYAILSDENKRQLYDEEGIVSENSSNIKEQAQSRLAHFFDLWMDAYLKGERHTCIVWIGDQLKQLIRAIGPINKTLDERISKLEVVQQRLSHSTSKEDSMFHGIVTDRLSHYKQAKRHNDQELLIGKEALEALSLYDYAEPKSEDQSVWYRVPQDYEEYLATVEGEPSVSKSETFAWGAS